MEKDKTNKELMEEFEASPMVKFVRKYGHLTFEGIYELLEQQAELITKQQKALEMFDYLVGAMVTHTFTHGEIHQKVREIRAVLEKPWNA